MRFLQKRGRAGLEEHLDFIKDICAKAQAMVDTVSDPKDRPNRRDDEHVERDPKKGSGHNIFKQPRRVSDCRICVALEADGGTGLFENHIRMSQVPGYECRRKEIYMHEGQDVHEVL